MEKGAKSVINLSSLTGETKLPLRTLKISSAIYHITTAMGYLTSMHSLAVASSWYDKTALLNNYTVL